MATQERTLAGRRGLIDKHVLTIRLELGAINYQNPRARVSWLPIKWRRIDWRAAVLTQFQVFNVRTASVRLCGLSCWRPPTPRISRFIVVMRSLGGRWALEDSAEGGDELMNEAPDSIELPDRENTR
ncbi:unnamed protein product, partial [Nesidiocoris tenuis]